MQLRTLPDTERGCGTLKEGGFYCRGDRSPNGTLQAWVWALGQHIIGGQNYTVTVPARQMQVINLPQTLLRMRLVSDVKEPRGDIRWTDNFERLPVVAVIDHIGADNYTPWSFAQECRDMGPSRRIPENVAKVIAQHCPMPILFTHSDMPLVDERVLDEVSRWADVPAGAAFEPAPFAPRWGLNRNDYRGDDHWIIPVLEQLHRSKATANNLIKHLPAPVAENILFAEQLLGISWITRCVYIAPEGESEERLQDIFNSGIEPVRLDNPLDDDAEAI